MSEMQLIVKPTVGSIQFDYDGLKTQLTEVLKKYKGLVFTDDQIGDAKKTRANLNNFKKSLNDEKIKIKNEFMDPYAKFESQIKELMGMVDECSSDIDEQVKAYEKKCKDEKLEHITAYWNEKAAAIDIAIEFNKIFDPKWLNASVKDNTWQSQIDQIVASIQKDLHAIVETYSDHNNTKLDFLIGAFKESLDIGDALGRWNEHERKLKEAAEYRERVASQMAQNQPQTQQIAQREEVTTPVQNNATAPKNGISERVFEVTFKVTGSFNELRMLNTYIKQNNIQYKLVEQKEVK